MKQMRIRMFPVALRAMLAGAVLGAFGKALHAADAKRPIVLFIATIPE